MIAWKSAVPTVEKSKSESLTCLSFVLFPITAVGMYNSGMCCISVFNSRSFYLKILRINLLLLLCVYAWYVCVGWVSVPGCVCVYVKGQLYYRVTSGFLPLRGFQGLIQVTRFVLHVPFWLYWCKVCTGALCHIIKLMSCYMSKFCFHCFMIFFRNLSKKIGYYHTCLIFHIKKSQPNRIILIKSIQCADRSPKFRSNASICELFLTLMIKANCALYGAPILNW